MSSKLANTFLITLSWISLCSAVCNENEYECTAAAGDTPACITLSWMCDDYPDCPNGEDEVHDICGVPCAPSPYTSYSPSGSSGTIACGDTVEGTASQSYQTLSYSFTLPSGAGYTHLKITACYTENEVPAYLEMYNSDYTSSVWSQSNAECSCNDRPLIIANTSTALVPGEDYVVNFWPYSAGRYYFTVACDSVPFSATPSSTCTETYNPLDTTTYEPWWSGYSTTYGSWSGYTSTYGSWWGGYTDEPSLEPWWGFTDEPTLQPTCDPTMGPITIPGTGAPTAPTTNAPTAPTTEPTTKVPTAPTTDPTTRTPTAPTTAPIAPETSSPPRGSDAFGLNPYVKIYALIIVMIMFLYTVIV